MVRVGTMRVSVGQGEMLVVVRMLEFGTVRARMVVGVVAAIVPVTVGVG